MDERLASFGHTAAAAVQRAARLVGKALLAAAPLVVHVVGGDAHSEGADRGAALWRPLLEQMLAASSRGRRVLRIVVVGPGMRSSKTIETTTGDDVVIVEHVRALYHEWWYDKREVPELVLMFHPGLWGYGEWRATLRCLARMARPVPVVVTSYTVQEAALDALELRRVIREADDGVSGSRGDSESDDEVEPAVLERHWLWPPEVNPHGARCVRPTATAPPGHEYRDNAAWQCVVLASGWQPGVSLTTTSSAVGDDRSCCEG
mmetsp:Transcript_24388/g.96761  ORF Transcript_24388/g.96761 Transcript_24388/m.96761 type:complete len:262 (-) Transcript_24388:34-819(-)